MLNNLELLQWKQCYFWSYDNHVHKLLNINHQLKRIVDNTAVCTQLSVDDRGLTRIGRVAPAKFEPFWLELCFKTQSIQQQTTTTKFDTNNVNNNNNNNQQQQQQQQQLNEREFKFSFDISFKDNSWQNSNEIDLKWTKTILNNNTHHQSNTNIDQLLSTSPTQTHCISTHINKPMKMIQISLISLANDDEQQLKKQISTRVAFSNITLNYYLKQVCLKT